MGKKRSDVVWITSDIIFSASDIVFPVSHVVFCRCLEKGGLFRAKPVFFIHFIAAISLPLSFLRFSALF